MADLRVPVLIQATPDSAGSMTIADRRDSFCGKMSVCNNLQQYRIPYSLTKLHTEAPDSAEFTSDIAWFAAVCRVANGMRKLRIGAIGARPAAFNTVRYSEKLLESNGITVEPLDLSEIFGRIGRLKCEDPDVQAKARAIRQYVPTEGIPDDAIMKMAMLGLVIDRWMTDNDLDISAVQCWTSMEEFFGVVPCTVMSMMSNGLNSSACEVDVPGVVGMHALRLASETPSALLDWNNNYGDDPDKAVCFHCSNLPKHFFEEARMDYQEIIAGTVGKLNTFGTCVGKGEGLADELRRASPPATPPAKCAATSARAASPTIRCRPSAAPGSSKSRASRTCCTTSARTASSTMSPPISARPRQPFTRRARSISAGTCTGINRSRAQYGNRCRRRFRNAQRPGLHCR